LALIALAISGRGFRQLQKEAELAFGMTASCTCVTRTDAMVMQWFSIFGGQLDFKNGEMARP
jgi:hypothetical protein